MEGWPILLLLLGARLLLVLLDLPLLPLHLPGQQALIKALASAYKQYPGHLYSGAKRSRDRHARDLRMVS